MNYYKSIQIKTIHYPHKLYSKCKKNAHKKGTKVHVHPAVPVHEVPDAEPGLELLAGEACQLSPGADVLPHLVTGGGRECRLASHDISESADWHQMRSVVV